MSSNLDIPVLQRPAFFGGQQLTAADLTAAQLFQRELRWLHNRSLHNWGIALGYAVSGARGDGSVKVEQGFALDCKGRELILTESMELPVPSVAGANGAPVEYYLTVSYANDASITAEMRAGICAASGAVRRPERPVIRWQSPSDTDAASRYRSGLDIILATIKVQNCRLAKAVSLNGRRSAVPAPQPYVAAGHAPVQATSWQLWPQQNPVGVTTTVKTLNAGFQTKPQYQAHVTGKRIFDGKINNKQHRFIVDGYAQIAGATATSFELRVILPAGAFAGETESYLVKSVDLRDHILFDLAGGDAAILNLIYLINHLKEQTLSLAVGQQLHVPQLIEHDSLNLFESLEDLASEHSTTAEAILLANGLNSADDIDPFQDLLIPSQLVTRTLTFVDFKELLQSIAAQFNTGIEMIMTANGLTEQTLSLSAGQSLLVPGEALLVNPSDAVLKPDFMDLLRDELGWSVVWMGTEGLIP